MTEIQGKSPSDRISQYLSDHPELTQNEQLEEPVEIEDKNAFKEKIVSSVSKSVNPYLKAAKDKLLAKIRVDDSIPLDLHISRGSKSIEGQFVCNALFLELKKEGQDKNVAEFALRDYGDEFRLSHRKVDPNYRGNGIATSAMKAIEEFVKEYARKVPGREPIIEANAAQLDVLKWFDRNGFESTMDPVPVHSGENNIKIHNIDEVLLSLENGDGNYRVGPYMYVFLKEYKGSYFDGKGEEPENIMIDESALVHLRKRLDVESKEACQQPEILHPNVELLMNTTASDVAEVLYSARKGLRKYEITRADDSKMEVWKKSIDELVEAIRNMDADRISQLMQKDGRYTGDPEAIYELINTEQFDETDMTLLAIGLFILREKSPWNARKAGMKVLKGGKYNMESFFTEDGWANCYDISVSVKEFAKMYGIQGEVHGKGISHAHFETKEGKISDPMYGWKRGGIFQSKKQFEKFKKDMGFLRRLGLS